MIDLSITKLTKEEEELITILFMYSLVVISDPSTNSYYIDTKLHTDFDNYHTRITIKHRLGKRQYRCHSKTISWRPKWYGSPKHVLEYIIEVFNLG